LGLLKGLEASHKHGQLVEGRFGANSADRKDP
jgi:hypothetical protein